MTARLSIGITTQNRPDALRACLDSLAVLRGLDLEVLVFDDGSEPPANAAMGPGLPPVRVIRDDSRPGYIVGRNRLVRDASAPAVLLLDDDTRLLSRESVEQALAVFDSDSLVAAVAFAQAEANGRLWAATMQPSTVEYPSVIPCFIGFAHLLRRTVFLELGGYREAFVFYGEEKELCLRLIDAGYKTVFLPKAGVAHLPDPAGRSRTRYLRFVVRNDCLSAMFNDPFPRVLWTLPMRYMLYFRMRHGWGIPDPWGWVWIARQLAGPLVRSVWHRRPVSRAAIRTWRQLKRAPVPYPAAEPRRAASG